MRGLSPNVQFFHCATLYDVGILNGGFRRLLGSTGKVGRVDYTDERIGSFLGNYGAHVFFRKRLQYKFESEWRVLRRLDSLEKKGETYLGSFGPSTLRSVIITRACTVEHSIRMILAHDSRYHHVTIKTLDI